jgi:hypothetical protein
MAAIVLASEALRCFVDVGIRTATSWQGAPPELRATLPPVPVFCNKPCRASERQPVSFPSGTSSPLSPGPEEPARDPPDQLVQPARPRREVPVHVHKIGTLAAHDHELRLEY